MRLSVQSPPASPSAPANGADVIDLEPAQLSPAVTGRAGVRTWLYAVRLRQWPKNLLVLAAPAAAGVLLRPHVLARVLIALAAFCLLASATYLLNDVHDVAEDRRHPVKRHRPIASGAISPRVGATVGVALMVLGLGASAVVGWQLLATAGAYVLLNVAYTGWLRRVAIADIATIALAFLIRALAGGTAAGVPVSRWFIVVISFCALFVAAGKRYADLLDPASRQSRRALDEYSEEFLRLVLTVACAVALGAYCLWAFGHRGADMKWDELTIVPFTLALLRYGMLTTRGAGSAPERALFGDGFMRVAGIAWLILFALGI